MISRHNPLITALFVTACFALPAASMAGNPDDIRERVKKVGELNMSTASAAESSATASPVAEAAAAAPAAVSEEPALEAAETKPAETEAVAASDETAVADLYTSACFACHGTGAAGAPILGDNAAWQPRIAKGEAVLLESAINGLNGLMPPRGGSSLSDEEIEAVLSYMIENSQ